MEEEIKAPDYPSIEGNFYLIDDIEAFFSKDKEVIKSFLNNQLKVINRPSFSISSDDMCLMTSKESFKVDYAYMRDHFVMVASLILKSSKDIIIEDIEIPITEKNTCSFKIKFKEK